jgi:hypothetical protein
LLAFFLLTLSTAPSAVAQAPDLDQGGLRLVDQRDGAYLAGVADGSRIFLGEGPRVVAYRFDDEGRALRLGQSEPLPGVVRDLALHADGRLAAAAGAGGIWLLAAGDSPRALGGLATRRRFTDVAWSGSWLVAAAAPSTIVLYEHADGRWLEHDHLPTQRNAIIDLAAIEGGVAVLEPQALLTVRIDAPANLRPFDYLPFDDPMQALRGRAGQLVAVGYPKLNLVGVTTGGIVRIDRAIPDGGHTLALSSQSVWLANNDHVTRVGGPSWPELRPLSHGAETTWPIDALVATEDDRFALAAGRESWARRAIRSSDTWNAAGLATFERTDAGLATRWAENRPGDLLRIIEAWLPTEEGEAGTRRHVVLGHDHRAVWAYPSLSSEGGTTPLLGKPYPLVPPGVWSSIQDIAVWRDQLFVAEGTAVHVIDLGAPPLSPPIATLGPMPGVIRSLWTGERVMAVF